MQVDENIIAKKYAVAFLNLYEKACTPQKLERIRKLEDFVKSNKDFYISLRIPSIPKRIKWEALIKLCTAFSLQGPFQQLVQVLLEHRRIELFHKILQQIRLWYKRVHNIQRFTITTSHLISHDEQAKIIQFIKRVSDASLITKFVVDHRLIIGVRIESNTFLWERSINMELRNLHHEFLEKG